MRTIATRFTLSTLRATRIIRSTNSGRRRLLRPSIDELDCEENKMTTLQDKTALVTGASRGIGRATAAALAKAGAHVLVHYGRSAKEAESLVSEIQAQGGRAEAISADLGTPNGVARLAKQGRAIVGDRLDVLVLNAGISKAATIKDHPLADSGVEHEHIQSIADDCAHLFC